MKKNFSAPEIKMYRFQNKDIICTSSTEIPVDLNGSGAARVHSREFLDDDFNMWEE